MKILILISIIIASAGIYLIASQPKPSSRTLDQLTVSQDVYDNQMVAFKWSGPIDPPMAQALEEEFDHWKDKITRIRIDLHSPGGLVDEGERVISVINDMKRTHRVQTYVGPENECLSMCVPIFMQGHLRIASASSTWMFHEPRAIDTVTGNDTYIYEYEQLQSTQDVYYRFFKRSEIDPVWRENLKRQWRFGEVWKTGRELKDERSNIIMILE